jgi:hypothetical protein
MEVLIPVVFIIVAIIAKAVNKSSRQARTPGTPSPRVQKLIERIQAQQGLNQPIQFQGQFTQPTSGPPQVVPGQVINSAGQVVRPAGPVQDPGRAQASAQLSGMLQQLMQAGQTAGRFGQQITGPGQYTQQPGPGQQYPGPQTGYMPPGQFQAVPPPWTPAYQPPPAKRPQNKGDLDTRIRELLSTGNEVAAVRLICDEKDLGIIDAQKYARSLVAGPAKARSTTTPAGSDSGQADTESRYVGSAAFAESVFTTRDDDNVWASGWVDKPEVEDRTDIDELWETVQNAGRPKPPPKS